MQAYDEASNVKRLERLPTHLRVVFALLSAFRILPSYARFNARTGRGDPKVLAKIAGTLWTDCIEGTLTDGEAQLLSEKLLELVPTDDDGWDEETQPYAEDAAAAVAYAYRARLTGNPQEAAWAARRVYESAEQYVRNNLESVPGASDDERAILSHQIVQSEIARQRRDLADLAKISEQNNFRNHVIRLRERSVNEAASFFDLGSE